MKTIEKVKEFHEKFGHPVHNRPVLDNEKINELSLI